MIRYAKGRDRQLIWDITGAPCVEQIGGLVSCDWDGELFVFEDEGRAR